MTSPIIVTLEPLPQRVGPLAGPHPSPERRSHGRGRHNRPYRDAAGSRRGTAEAGRAGPETPVAVRCAGYRDGESCYDTSDPARTAHPLALRAERPRPPAYLGASAGPEYRFRQRPHVVDCDATPTEVQVPFAVMRSLPSRYRQVKATSTFNHQRAKIDPFAAINARRPLSWTRR